eukprot:TRINITY_DN3397_c0_g1_i3.p1 TRINITY_DN3397_c0_g1~~TRINITY_DN3397_c0_g1_i3.p1  ORF type:complete len:2330 (-),score=299.84 TRINITY_DN3397_c0_g1_i3:580-7488(-)
MTSFLRCLLFLTIHGCRCQLIPQATKAQCLLQVSSGQAVLTAEVPSWTEERLKAMTVNGDASRCYIAIFEGKKCESPGGIYQISEAWYRGHLGGPAIIRRCGSVSQSWIKFGSHSMYRDALVNQEDFGDRARFVATLDCANTSQPAPSPTSTPPPTPPPPTPPPPTPSPPQPTLPEPTFPKPEQSSAADAVFLIQATFGPTFKSLHELKNVSYEAWIKEQIALPVSAHRSYYRERVNPHLFRSTRVGVTRSSCELGSRWQAFAFSLKDLGKYITVRDRQVFVSEVANERGLLRTEIDPRGSGNGNAVGWDIELFARICLVEEFLRGQVGLCRADDMSPRVQQTLENPFIWFRTSNGAVTLSDSEPLIFTPVRSGVLVLANTSSTCTLDTFIQSTVEDPQGRLYQYEPRLKLLENQLTNPVLASVPMSFLNEDHCTVVERVLHCGSPGEAANDPSKGHQAVFQSKQLVPVGSVNLDEDANGDASYDFADRVFDVPHGPGLPPPDSARSSTWLMQSLYAGDQLRQRMAWALSQILVTSAVGTDYSQQSEMWMNYYDIFIRHGLGNFRDVLREVTYSPVMGMYLDSLRNKAFDASQMLPNENFAREILQLFTIGETVMNSDGTPVRNSDGAEIPTYQNEHIMSLARVFTGFDTQPPRSNIEASVFQNSNFIDPMRMRPEWHDAHPKVDLDGGYIGDGLPQCSDLPAYSYLSKGARYVLRPVTQEIPAESWVRIMHCDGEASTDRMDVLSQDVPHVASTATQVKICTKGDSLDCVVSTPNSFPIEMLKQGRTVSHNGGAACDAACVAATWRNTGSRNRIRQLWSDCGHAVGQLPHNYMYHACDNSGGLHLSAMDGGGCGWAYRANDRLEVFVNANARSPSLLQHGVAHVLAPDAPWLPVDGGMGRVCRGATATDSQPSYYTLHQGVTSLDDCKAKCEMTEGCKGVEHNAMGGRCEVWTRPEGIQSSSADSRFACFIYDRVLGSAWMPMDGGVGRVCRGASATDTSSRYYILHQSVASLIDCKSRCETTAGCKGIEYSSTGQRCEVWTLEDGIQASASNPNFICLRYEGAKGSTTLTSTASPHPNSKWSPVDGGMGQVCRGATATDSQPSYYTLHQGVTSLDDCKAKCEMTEGCKGVEHNAMGGRCEVWTRPEGIQSSAANSRFACFRYSAAAPISTTASIPATTSSTSADPNAPGGSPSTAQEISAWPGTPLFSKFCRGSPCTFAASVTLTERVPCADPYCGVRFASTILVENMTYDYIPPACVHSYIHDGASLELDPDGAIRNEVGGRNKIRVNWKGQEPTGCPSGCTTSDVTCVCKASVAKTKVFSAVPDVTSLQMLKVGSHPPITQCASNCDGDVKVFSLTGIFDENTVFEHGGRFFKNVEDTVDIGGKQFRNPPNFLPPSQSPANTGATPVTTTALASQTTSGNAGICYDKLRAVATDEGVGIGDKIDSLSSEDCERICTDNEQCQSFAFCPYFEGCWMKRKAFSGNEPTRDFYDCVTFYKKPCDGTSPPTPSPPPPTPRPTPPTESSLAYSRTLERAALNEVESALDMLFRHQNTPTFIAYRLIQRLVTSNPSPQYIQAVAQAFQTGRFNGTSYSGKYGDLAATAAAILLHPEARQPGPAWVGKFREPLLKVLHFMRSMEFKGKQGRMIMMKNLERFIGQFPYQSPTVFNFYRPSYALNVTASEEDIGNHSELVAPELEIFDSPNIRDFTYAMLAMIEHQGLSSCKRGFGVDSFDCAGMAEPRSYSGTLAQAWDEMDMLLTGSRLGGVKDVLMNLSGAGANIVQEEADRVGNWGGSCTCPDGSVYQVGDNNDACASLACLGGAAGQCFRLSGPWSRRKVTCDPNPCNLSPMSCTATKSHVQGAQYAIVMTPHFHTLGNVAHEGVRVPPPNLQPASTRNEYKAMVILYMFGGADTFNMLVPVECELYQQYLGIRRGVALSSDQLHRVETVGQACSQFGIHSQLEILKQLYDEGEAAFVTNVGNLIRPGVGCPGNFGHSGMQHASQTLVCQMGGALSHGGGGRMADALTEAGIGSVSSFSLRGNVPWSQGLDTQRRVISGTRVDSEDGDYWPGNVQRIIDNITIMDFSTVYAKEYVNQIDASFHASQTTAEVLRDAGNVLQLPNANYGAIPQLRQVATLIGARSTRQAERDFFFVGLGGFDNHNNLGPNLARNFGRMNVAITAFVNEIKAQGNWDNVVMTTQSDFARTLDPNGNMGTDHGWAGQHFILSGAINGGRVYNDFPASLAAGNPADLGRGRLIPSYPYESFMVPIAQWLGVQAAQLQDVFPNLPNFNITLHTIPGLF